MPVLTCDHVSVRYKVGDFRNIGLKETIMRKLKGSYRVEEFWADRDITFSLERGDMLGIIGTNGAGKSTLLKAVAGIMLPSGGRVEHEGNISALLELASGFDPDLSIRRNAYLRGAMLGYTREFMDEKYEEIIDFAELRAFEDRSFKQLSTGIKYRQYRRVAAAYLVYYLIQFHVRIYTQIVALDYRVEIHQCKHSVVGVVSKQFALLGQSRTVYAVRFEYADGDICTHAYYHQWHKHRVSAGQLCY